MSDAASGKAGEVKWVCAPEAAQLVEREVQRLLHETPELAAFAARVNERTGMRLADWMVEIGVGEPGLESELRATGFEPVVGMPDAFRHPGALLPTVRLVEGPSQLLLHVDEVADFIASNAGAAQTAMSDGQTKTARVIASPFAEVWVQSDAWEETPSGSPEHHGAAFRERPRDAEDPRRDFAAARSLIRVAQASLGVERTARLFFKMECAHWEKRNHAAQLQKARQDELGLGWGSVDHFTYRSSRIHFAELIETLELLGLSRRERFHAGAEAGWGAQVMGFEEAGIVVFADVDLEPDEVSVDFSRGSLARAAALGTVGLWSCLHGEAFCGAGLHHVARQGAFTDLRARVASDGIESMEPFANLPYLKQCFTRGESWNVSEERLLSAVRQGAIAPERALAIRSLGAVGSHLELIERADGYKGFLQRGVSEIIRLTDPRRDDATRPAA